MKDQSFIFSRKHHFIYSYSVSNHPNLVSLAVKYKLPSALFSSHVRINNLWSALEGFPGEGLEIPEACGLHPSPEVSRKRVPKLAFLYSAKDWLTCRNEGLLKVEFAKPIFINQEFSMGKFPLKMRSALCLGSRPLSIYYCKIQLEAEVRRTKTKESG